MCPDFLIETYLDHAGEKWCLTYDPNSLLYISKAMDLFDMGKEHQVRMEEQRSRNAKTMSSRLAKTADAAPAEVCTLTLPEVPYQEQDGEDTSVADEALAGNSMSKKAKEVMDREPPEDLIQGLAPLSSIPTLVMGVASDILFPAWQQREVADTLRRTGNRLSLIHI